MLQPVYMYQSNTEAVTGACMGAALSINAALGALAYTQKPTR